MVRQKADRIRDGRNRRLFFRAVRFGSEIRFRYDFGDFQIFIPYTRLKSVALVQRHSIENENLRKMSNTIFRCAE